MATEITDTSLGEDHLNILHRALYPARHKYKSFGLQIGLKISEIEDIEERCAGSGDRLLGILSIRVKKAEPFTWKDIYTALKLDCVGESKTADDIRKEYGHTFSADSSFEQISGHMHEKKSTKHKSKEKQRDYYPSHIDRNNSDVEVSGSKTKHKHLSGEKVAFSKRKTKVSLGQHTEQPHIFPKRKTAAFLESSSSEEEIVSSQQYKFKMKKSRSSAKNIENASVSIEKKEVKFQRAKDASSDSTYENESENKESGLNDTTEDEEVEEKSSNGEEVDDESSAAVSEDEEKEIFDKTPSVNNVERKILKCTESRRNNDARIKRAGYSYGHCDHSDHDDGTVDHREHDIKGSKRSHMESSMIPVATSHIQTYCRRQRDKRKHGRDCKRNQRKEVILSSSFSDTDDSSPESDALKKLSVIQIMELKNIFKCNFGKLCCAIKDPVETAAKLQAEQLLCLSEMENIVASPSFKQLKTIYLVRTLYRRIKSHPGCIFTITKVFLQIYALKEIGNEILVKAEKVCPELCSELFHPENLPFVESMFENDSGATPDKAIVSTSMQQFTSSKKTSGTLEVSQACLSPVLTRYKKYLQSCYDAIILAPADKYLPSLDVPYINLAIIRRARLDPEQRDKFTMTTLHGGVDEILQIKEHITIEDLLTEEDSKNLISDSTWHEFLSDPFFGLKLVSDNPSNLIKSSPSNSGPVRFVLVEGPPGIGKSTFAWEVCRRWDEVQSLRKYNIVVLLKLRERWVLKAQSLSDLFRYPPNPKMSNSIAEELAQLHGEKLLLVLDGFDEASHHFNESSAIKNILCRKLLPKCSIILTTRPSAKSILQSVCQPRVDKRVEIIGFTEEERVRYITKVFSKEPELQVNFLKYMFHVPHIKSMMYIPINCAIIAQVYYESQSSRHLAIPRTRTQLYKALTHSLLVRHTKAGKHNYDNLPDGLNKADKEKFKVLTKFAFDSYHSESRKVTFFKEDVPKGLVHFGFMNELNEMYASKGVEQIFSFLHLSLQEYLAALHLANTYSTEFHVAYHWLAKNAYTPHHNQRSFSFYKGIDEEEEALLQFLKPLGSSLIEPASFLAGITGLKSPHRNQWETYILHCNTPYNYNSLLVSSLYESQNTVLTGYYLHNQISLGWMSTPYECYCLSYAVAHSFSANDLTLSLCCSVSQLETFVKGLDDHCQNVIPQVSLLLLLVGHDGDDFMKYLCWVSKTKYFTNLRRFNFESKHYIIRSNLLHDVIQSFPKLQSLVIDIDSPSSLEWLSALRSLTDLRLLHIHASKASITQATDFNCWPVRHKLKEIMVDMHIPSYSTHDIFSPADKLVQPLLRSILKSDQITKIELSMVSRNTMQSIVTILSCCPKLKTLELKRTNLGYDGIIYICGYLRHNKQLEHLLIHDDIQSPPSKSIQCNARYAFSPIMQFPLPNRVSCTNFLLELNNILTSNTTLKKISVISGLFKPIRGGINYPFWWCCQWTGLAPLAQFNVGAVVNGTSPNLRRSFSSSDLTQPETQLFLERDIYLGSKEEALDFRKLFSRRKERGMRLCSHPSFTAPDTEVVQSFSGLDPRLIECLLGISNDHHFVKELKESYERILEQARLMQKMLIK